MEGRCSSGRIERAGARRGLFFVPLFVSQPAGKSTAARRCVRACAASYEVLRHVIKLVVHDKAGSRGVAVVIGSKSTWQERVAKGCAARVAADGTCHDHQLHTVKMHRKSRSGSLSERVQQLQLTPCQTLGRWGGRRAMRDFCRPPSINHSPAPPPTHVSRTASATFFYRALSPRPVLCAPRCGSASASLRCSHRHRHRNQPQ